MKQSIALFLASVMVLSGTPTSSLAIAEEAGGQVSSEAEQQAAEAEAARQAEEAARLAEEEAARQAAEAEAATLEQARHPVDLRHRQERVYPL